MKRLVMIFVWLGVFLLLLVMLDQVLLRYRDFERPFLNDVQEFHADFRRRLMGLPPLQTPESRPAPASRPALTPKSKPATPVDKNVDAVVEREITRVAQQATSASPAKEDEGSLRYIYLDAEQNIQFAERYEEIPPRFRDAVQVVGEQVTHAQ
jgi:hypothetical protein